MDSQAFLDWAATLLDIKHTGKRHYVSVQRRNLNLGIDAGHSGTMKVHLFSNAGDLVLWMASLPSTTGPLPAVARPEFRKGANDRSYYGFEWRHDSTRSFASEQATVKTFVTWLRGVAEERGIEFPGT